MPPKAKVKAKARAKAALRRPAALERRGLLRRPAVGGTPWERGEEVPLHQVSPLDLRPGCLLAVTEGYYFGARVKLACEVIKMEMEYGETTLVVKAKGTDSEALLRTHTAQPNQVFRCHVCQEGCSRQDVGDYKVHALKGRQIKRDGDEPWTGNLGPEKEEDDENANLRRRVALLAQEGRVEDADREVREGVPALPRQGEMPGGDKKKKKKKKEKKDKHILDGRHPGLAGQKTTQEVFGGTALDPRERVRRRVLSKAQKFVSSKKSKSTSGSSNSSSSSSSSLEEVKGLTTVFAEETKIRGVAERYPGALAMESLASMKRSLLTAAGEDQEEGILKPVALLYYRSVLSKRASGPQSREMLNLSTALDMMLKGRIASAADVIAQRLKAQEAITQGTHWAIAQRLEIPPSEAEGLVARTELQQAQKEDYADARARWRSQSTSQGKGEAKGKNKWQKGDREPWKKEERKEDPGKKGKGKEKK